MQIQRLVAGAHLTSRCRPSGLEQNVGVAGRAGRRKVRRYARMPQPGIVSWQSHQQITKARKLAGWGAAFLAGLAALWVPAFFEGVHSDAFTGGVILEVFTLVPLALTLLRIRRLNGLLRRMEGVSAEEQEDHADELRRVDEALYRIARLVRQLRGAVAETAGLEGFSSAERAALEWRRLLRRQHELEEMVEMASNAEAKSSLQRSLDACSDDIAGFQAEVEELAAALAQLVDSSDDGHLADELHRLQTAGDRVEALAASFEEVNALADESMERLEAPG